MKFSIYKASKDKRSLRFFGSIEASSLEVAGDLLYKVLRRKSGQKDGDYFLIVPSSDCPPPEKLFEEGTPFQVLQYREIN